MSGEWTAYCAPGRKPVVEILVIFGEEHVTEVIEHPWFAGRSDYLLVNQSTLGLSDLAASLLPLR